MSQRVEFVFCDFSQVEKFRLSFELFPNSLTRRWVATMLLMSNDVLEHEPVGAMFVDEDRVRMKIEAGVAKAEVLLREKMLEKPLPVFATTKHLNPLREACQKIVDRHVGETGQPALIRTVVGQIVKDLALYESLYAPEHHFQINLTYSTENRFFLRDEEFTLFTPNRRDGWLYLDYAKTGVAPFNAYLQKLETKLTPQDSFLANTQILYREDHDYESDVAIDANRFISKLLPDPDMQTRLAIGQIPLGRPLHTRSRLEVLELLTRFEGSVRVELFENDTRLTAAALKSRLSPERRSLRLYHPYGLGLRFSLFGIPVKIPGVVFGWYAYGPRKARQIGYRLSWPARKIYYFSSYVWQNRARLIEVRLNRIKYFISVLEPYVWKLSWPLRKIVYMGRYGIRKYVLGKPDKEA